MTKTNIAIASRTPTFEVPVPACDDIAAVSRTRSAIPASDGSAIITGVTHVSVGDGPEFHDLDAILPGDVRARRRMVARTTLRISATALALLLLYAVVPVPGTSGAAAVVGLIGGLIVFVGLVGWQTRSIVRAHQPVLRAVEVVAFALPLLVVVFAYTYLSLSEADPAAFSEKLDRIGPVYFAVSILGTVGLGDISPATDATRVLVTLQTLLDIVLIAGFVKDRDHRHPYRVASEGLRALGPAASQPVIAAASAASSWASPPPLSDVRITRPGHLDPHQRLVGSRHGDVGRCPRAERLLLVGPALDDQCGGLWHLAPRTWEIRHRLRDDDAVLGGHPLKPRVVGVQSAYGLDVLRDEQGARAGARWSSAPRRAARRR